MDGIQVLACFSRVCSDESTSVYSSPAFNPGVDLLREEPGHGKKWIQHEQYLPGGGSGRKQDEVLSIAALFSYARQAPKRTTARRPDQHSGTRRHYGCSSFSWRSLSASSKAHVVSWRPVSPRRTPPGGSTRPPAYRSVALRRRSERICHYKQLVCEYVQASEPGGARSAMLVPSQESDQNNRVLLTVLRVPCLEHVIRALNTDNHVAYCTASLQNQARNVMLYNLLLIPPCT